MVEVFKAYEVVLDAKVAFTSSSYIKGMKWCWVRIFACFLKLDLSFLNENSKSKEELPLMGPGVMMR